MSIDCYSVFEIEKVQRSSGADFRGDYNKVIYTFCEHQHPYFVSAIYYLLLIRRTVSYDSTQATPRMQSINGLIRCVHPVKAMGNVVIDGQLPI